MSRVGSGIIHWAAAWRVDWGRQEWDEKIGWSRCPGER